MQSLLTDPKTILRQHRYLWRIGKRDVLFVIELFTCNITVQHVKNPDSVLLADNKGMVVRPAHRKTARGRLPGAAVVPVHKPTACLQ